MLTIGKLGSSRGQLGYYEEQVASGIEDYYAGRGEARDTWLGSGAGGWVFAARLSATVSWP